MMIDLCPVQLETHRTTAHTPQTRWRTAASPAVAQGECMTDKRMSADDVAAQVRDRMTGGIGGWGWRRKPMSWVRALLRTDVRDLTVVSFGGPDVGLLCQAGKVRKVVYGFVSLDSIALDPHFRAAREAGSLEIAEYDEGMCLAGLRAAAHRLPFMPIRAGLS